MATLTETRERESAPSSDDAADGAIFATVAQSLDPVRLARQGATQIEQVAPQWHKAWPEQLAGRIAEELHATTFKIDAASKGLTARAFTRAATGKGIGMQRAEAAAKLLRTQVARAVRSGALIGAAVGGGLSAIANTVDLMKGRKSAPEATVDTLKDTVVCAATGAAVGGVSVAAEAALLKAGVGALSRGAAPVAVGLTVVEVGKDVGRLLQGNMSKKELALKTGKNVVKGGTTWGGMEGGAAIGTLIFPGIGTVVGGALGGIAGAMLGGWVTK